ncbi:MAG: hypothetical protein KY475_24660, partial [Planctomycetes bacterium]|nr:hypothetical protein [Planctomycetota bacterium]
MRSGEPAAERRSGDAGPETEANVVTALAQQRRAEPRPTPPPLPSQRRPPPVPPPANDATHRSASVPVAAPPIAGLPAEAPSALDRYNPGALRRRWWWERWRETPCWLTSRVVPLAVMLVIG